MNSLAKELLYHRPSPLQAEYPEAKIDPAIVRLPRDFQLLLDQFNGGLRFKKLLLASWIGPNELLYKIESVQGLNYFIFETDFIENFWELQARLKDLFGANPQFIEAAHSPVSFFDCAPARFYLGDRAVPRDFDLTKQYFNWQHGTEDYYFTFLFKLANQTLPYEADIFEEPKHGIATLKQEVTLPYPLVLFLRIVNEDIQARKIDTLIPSISAFKCEYAFGGLSPTKNQVVSEYTYKFTYFPTFAEKDKEMVCRWVLYLTKQQIEDIALKKTMSLPLWACEEPSCECKYSYANGNCHHVSADDRDNHRKIVSEVPTATNTGNFGVKKSSPQLGGKFKLKNLVEQVFSK